MSDYSFAWFPVTTLEQNFAPLPSEFRPLTKQGAYFWTVSELQVAFWAACKEYEARRELRDIMDIVRSRGKQYLTEAVNRVWMGEGGDYTAVREYANAYSQYLDTELQQLTTEVYSAAYSTETCLRIPPLNPQLQLSCLASLLRLTILSFDPSWTPRYALPAFSASPHSAVVAVKVADRYSLCFDLNTPYSCFFGDCLHRMLTGYRSLSALTRQEKLPAEAYPVIRAETERCKAAAVRVAPLLQRLMGASKDIVVSLQFEVTKCQHQEIGIRLKCLHWACWRCVFPQTQYAGQAPWFPGAACGCPNCSYSLSIPEVVALLTDATFRQLLESLAFCCKCFATVSPKNVVSLPCGHRGCLPCALRAVYDKTPMCGLCDALPPKGHLKNMAMAQCDVCWEYRSASCFPPVGCNGLVACRYCFSRADACPHANHNSHALSSTDTHYLQRLFFTCGSCSQPLNRQFLFVKAGCLCLRCHACVIAEMVKVGRCDVCPFCAEAVAEQCVREMEAEFNAIPRPELPLKEEKHAEEEKKEVKEEIAVEKEEKAAENDQKEEAKEEKAGKKDEKEEEKDEKAIKKDEKEEEKQPGPEAIVEQPPAEAIEGGKEPKAPKPKKKKRKSAKN